MKIIIEGPDRTGKSTLIQNIKNHFNKHTFHALHYSNVKCKDTISYNTKLYTEMFTIMESIDSVICDRSHLGEMVYGPIYRGYTGHYVLNIEKLFPQLLNKIYLITCYDDPENLISRDDGLSFSTDLEKKKIEIDNFKNAHNSSNIHKKLLLNIKHHNEQQAIQKVVKFIKENNDD